MKTVMVEIVGMSPYSQSKAIRSERGTQEAYNEYEERVWRERMNVDESGIVVIPGMAIKNALTSVAAYLSMKVPGKRNATFTKHFKAGISVIGDISLRVKADTVSGVWQFVPSDGKPGGGNRVWRCFPTLPKWGGIVEIAVLDDMITQDAFEEHFKKAGQFVGVGRFRPERNGSYGRFNVISFTWD